MKNELKDQDVQLIDHAQKCGFVRDVAHYGRVMLHKKADTYATLELNIQLKREIAFPAIFLKQYRYRLTLTYPKWYESDETLVATDDVNDVYVYFDTFFTPSVRFKFYDRVKHELLKIKMELA